MSIKSQQANMKAIHAFVSHGLGYIYGERESGPNGAKKQFLFKSAAFLRALGIDLGLKEFKVSANPGGIAVSGDVTLRGMWNEGNGLCFIIEQPIQPFGAFLYQTVKSMKDCSGGRNQWLSCNLFAGGEYERLIKTLLELRGQIGLTEADRHAA
jgi:hypothetical protein